VQSRSRWVTIARAATTVAAVTVASAGVLYVSRVFELEESSFAKLDSTPVSAEQAWPSDSSRAQPRQAEMAGLGSDSSTRAVNSDLSQPATVESAAGTTSESLAQITMPELRRRAGEWRESDSRTDAARNEVIILSSKNDSVGDPAEGTPPSHSEPTDSVHTQSSSPPSDSSAGKAGVIENDVALQRILESKPSEVASNANEGTVRTTRTSITSSVDHSVAGASGAGKSDAKSMSAQSTLLAKSEARSSSALAETSPDSIQKKKFC
jgi:hypothetical protein